MLPRETVEMLRARVTKMEKRRQEDEAQYGPLMVWPETLTALLDAYERDASNQDTKPEP